ncbi:MAG TPA: PAS domain S-box protein [Negativicutes bacterium]|nr:PAS domain S-box protein [Negativicutes bacterium]
MCESDKNAQIIQVLHNVMTAPRVDSNLPPELLAMDGFGSLYSSLLQLRQVVTDIKEGQLTRTITEKGYLFGALQGLQASMRHLTWQTKAIAAGDFTQRVDFLGEFSDAFNHMTQQLAAAFQAAGEAKEHFELIFNSSPDATFITRLDDGLIINANPAFLAIGNFDKEKIIGQKSIDINLYENPGDRDRLIQAVRETGHCDNLEMKFKRINGATSTFLLSATTFTLQGKPHLISVIRDISERKLAEDALKKSEERYRILAENVKDVIWILDPETMYFLYVSPSVYSLRGYTPEEIMAEPIDAALTPEGTQHVRELVRRNVADLLSDSQTFEKYGVEELEQPCKDGTKVWTEVITNIYRNMTNGRVEILGVTRDISARKVAEQKLQKSEEKYRLLIENAAETIVVIQDATVQYCNPKATELSGYSQQELTAAPFAKFIHPDDRAFVIDMYQRRLQGQLADAQYQFRLMHKNQSSRWVELNSIFIEWEGKAATLNFLTDITERKQSEEAILYLSYHDQLTGLYNRRFYEEELSRLDTERNFPITLVMADVNGLKLTNDAFGHVAGDKLLQKLAAILMQECRSDEIAARIGGDEFMLLLPRTSAIEAERIVQRIQKATGRKKDEKLILSVSFGWSTKADSSTDMAAVFMQAEDQMYRHKLSESTSMKSETLKLITQSLYEKNAMEQHHCERVSELCKQTGRALELHPDDVSELGLVGMVHDIGKIGVDEKILNKAGKLEASERCEIQRHPEVGYQILRSVNEFSHIAEFILAHHERMDGTGYPRGLPGTKIPLQSRILSIAEAFDAMSNDCNYKKSLSETAAVAELVENAGTQFDAELVHVFVEKVLGRVGEIL